MYTRVKNTIQEKLNIKKNKKSFKKAFLYQILVVYQQYTNGGYYLTNLKIKTKWKIKTQTQ